MPRDASGSLFYRPVRHPVAALVAGALITVGALVLLAFTVVHLVVGTVGVSPWLLLSVLFVLAAASGGLIVGIVRVRWSRRHRRATGRSLRADSDGWRRRIIR
ncbi:hypothetical protein [Microbacterium sp. 18062]|uniref:hypothetical protein n=1 Tax=Microbacterium sp. 18062 TaxID=2681410 RepID=UPI00135C1232|nr:hypothetical protein [Microbacterium sp. 18062]